ncbi:HNH endonuclease [Lactobacillus phage P1]|uniref:HNH endonuclease n=1 Tax=Lactobacillus phage P1 TaxID=1846168 RepID=A0A1S5RCQ7_9CAUD|nr:HNH endonuclease [Lactobacillus phage P1]ANO57957.1 HNH endonuclease [Lactobacillus phage P1]APU93312.1 HNH endonuclease [Lactobacillus phage P2]
MDKSEKEIWKTYPEFDFIQASNLGRVRTVDRIVIRKNGRKCFIKGRVLKPYCDKCGYMIAQFSVNGEKVYRLVHRVIATCFLPNPDNLPEVIHRDCNPANNYVENLEWCTRKQNIAYRDKLGHTNYKNNAPKSPVIAVKLGTLKVLHFESQREAGRSLGVSHGNINSILKGKLNQTSGFWLTYADENAIKNIKDKFGDELARKVEQLMGEQDYN